MLRSGRSLKGAGVDVKKIILIFLALCSFLLAQDKPLQNVKLKLQWKHQFEFAGFYAAKEKGYYKDNGLDVEILESDGKTNPIDELINGDVQFITYYGTFIADIQNGKPLIFVANYLKSSPLAFAVKPDIYTPEQFKGKTIEASKGELESPDIQDFFMINRIDQKDFKHIDNSIGIEGFADGKADIITIFTTNEPYTLRQKKIPFSIIDPKHFGATSLYEDNLVTSRHFASENPTIVEAFKRASNKGWRYAIEHKEEIVDLILKKYNTQNKTKAQLLFEADATETLMQPRIFPIGSINSDYVSRIEELYIKFGKANRYILPSKFIFDPYGTIEKSLDATELSQEEKDYLRDFGPIKMCVDPDWFPLEKINKKGEYEGMGADIVKLYEKFLGQTITLLPTNSWQQTLEFIKDKKCDIIPMASPIKSRTRYMNFTEPYAKFLNIVSTKKEIPYITDFSSIKNKPIGVVKGYAITELLKERYPGIHLVDVDNVWEGLQQVEDGKLFAFVDIVPTVAYAIRDKGFINLKISGDTDVNMPLSIAVRKDKPKLLSILQKAVQNIEQRERENILNKWTSTLFQKKADYTYIWIFSPLALGVILLLLWWAYKLKSLNKKITNTKEKLELTLDAAKLTLWSIDISSKTITFDERHWQMAGYQKMPNTLPLKEFEGYLHHDDTKSIEQAIERYVKGTDSHYGSIYRYRNHDNTYRWIQSYGQSAERNRYGNPLVIIGVNIDITEQKEVEENLMRAKDELHALNSTLNIRINTEVAKNKNKDRLLQITERQVMIGEMLNTLIARWKMPLSDIHSVGINLEQILASGDLFEAKPILEKQKMTILEKSAFLKGAIRQLSDFFKISAEKTAFDIQKSIEEILELFGFHDQDNNFKITVIDGENINALGAKNEFQQVILSIIKNRSHFFQQKDITKPEITIKIEKQENNIVVFIQDNAEGMNEEELAKLFEPYTDTQKSINELYASLHSSKLILENMGGNIMGINSSGGSTFIITLPAS